MTRMPMRKSWRALPLCVAIAVSAGALTVTESAQAKIIEPGVEQAVKSVYPALVRIYVVMEKAQNGRIIRQRGSGSGAIISEDGYVVTNHHVAGNGSHFIVNLSNQEEVVADLVGTDPLADIAVLKIRKSEMKNPKAPLPVAKWGDSTKVKVGDQVFAMGSPGAVSQSVTQGIISNNKLIMPKNAAMPDMDGENVGSLVAWFAHDAVIFGGNSGGPLVDVNGDIIGINEIGFANLSGAIPAKVARHSAEQIIAHGKVPRSWNGMELQPRLRSGSEKSGALVSNVWPGSPADEAGVKPGDILVQYDGSAVDAEIPEHLPAINDQMIHTKIGKKVAVKVIRDGKAQKFSFVTDERQPARHRSAEYKSWGVTARDISRRNAIGMGRDNTDGVFVDSTRPGGVFEKASPALSKGDIITAINGEAVTSIEDFERITESLLSSGDESTPVLVNVDRKKAQVVSVVTLGKERENTPAGTLARGWLPMQTQVLTAKLAKVLNAGTDSGLRVTQIVEGEDLPLQVGDVIVSLDDERVEARRESDKGVLAAMLRQYRPGAEVEMVVYRDGKKQKLDVILQAAPKERSLMPKFESEELEFVAREMEAKEKNSVVAEKVSSGGWADLAGLRPGDTIQSVNGEEISDVEALQFQLNESKKRGDKRLVLFVKRAAHQKYLEVETEWN